MRPQSKAYFTPPPEEPAVLAGLRNLERILRPDQISIQWPDRLSYGRDSNSKAILWVRDSQVRYPPSAVVWPETSREISRLVKFAEQNGIPLIPFGGGSGVCGGTWALQGGIAVDLKRMDRVLRIDTKKMQVEAECGIIGEILERRLNRRRLTLGHFPSSLYAATLGGFLACRSAGQYSSLYGKIEDMVEGMEVVLTGGKVVKIEEVRNRPRTLSLKEVFLGSEGTLGLMTRATLRIHPVPEEEMFFGFSFDRLNRGLDAVREIMQRGLRPALIRLYDPMDTAVVMGHRGQEKQISLSKLSEILGSVWKTAKDTSLKMALGNSSLLNRLAGLVTGQCLLVLGFRGLSALLPSWARSAEKICLNHHGKSLGEEPGRYWLQHRYSVSYKLSPLFDQGFFADTLETATTWDNILPLYHAVGGAIRRHALTMAHFSHAYPEGCSIYFTFIGYRKDPEEAEALYDRIWNDAMKACVRAKGTISHHHGVGVLKGNYMKGEWEEAYGWLCKLKSKLDPKNIMNPGKLGFPLSRPYQGP